MLGLTRSCSSYSALTYQNAALSAARISPRFVLARDSKPWSGAVPRYEEIYNAGKLYELENMLEDCYPEGMSETELNDFIWFEEDTWRDWLDMEEEEEEE